MLKFTVLAASLALATAACPNQCSGHGRCGEDDKCVCYKASTGNAHPTRYGYFGVDCSLKTCPTGRSYDQLSTVGPSMSAITFKGLTPSSKDFLRAYFVPSARASSLNTLPRDQKVIVKIMTVLTSPSSPTTVIDGTFAWKYEEEEYFRPEQKLSKAWAMDKAFHLMDATTSGTGMYIWFDRTKNNAMDNLGLTTDKFLQAGDMYTFSLNVNDGYGFDEGNSNTAHQESECSGRGSCDFAAGKCKCFDGYTGDACQRTVCPNACSGHGACQAEGRFVSDLKDSNFKYLGTGKFDGGVYDTSVYNGAYDAAQQYGCKCDQGYRGPDCSMIECPSGADPMGGDGGGEGLDCSGRGICDYSSGVCKCFKGYYGERCDVQTNFV